MRTKINNEADFKILEKVVKRYRFNLLDEEPNEAAAIVQQGSGVGSFKRKLNIEEIYLSSSDDDDAAAASGKEKRAKTEEALSVAAATLDQPGTSSSSSSHQ